MNTIRTQKEILLKKLYEPYKNCQSCPLAKQGRTNVVFGRGNPDARLLFIGEGPGADEDAQGLPFVGRSGKLLSKVLDAIGIDENEIYITNIVKCRPPNNRRPTFEESNTCKKLLLVKQLEIIQPSIICTLGSTAFEGMTDQPCKITALRGKLYKHNAFNILPTFHPAYVLRNPAAIEKFIHDIEQAFTLSNKS